MPRPSKEWEKKYGKPMSQSKQMSQSKRRLLTGSDTVLTAATKLAAGYSEAQTIILMAMEPLAEIDRVLRVLDMDDMQMYGNKIIAAYREWACHDYAVLMEGVKDRDPGLMAFIRSK